ncbi:MAG: glycosyltransferase [Planctomycetes bacterium]|nr:glycosyltransferase [Planctomycetota bacterium]
MPQMALASRLGSRAVLLYGQVEDIDAGGRSLEVWPDAVCTDLEDRSLVPRWACLDALPPTPTVVARKEALVRAGLFPCGMRTAEDLDLWVRLLELGAFAGLKEVLAHRYLRPRSLTHSHGAAAQYGRYLAVLRRTRRAIRAWAGPLQRRGSSFVHACLSNAHHREGNRWRSLLHALPGVLRKHPQRSLAAKLLLEGVVGGRIYAKLASLAAPPQRRAPLSSGTKVEDRAMLSASPEASCRPKVSVVMPVYNGETYLRPAIASILDQTFRGFELLIINDGSRDGSVAVIESFTDPRVRLLDNATNKGLIHCLNQGLEAARGEYVARQDADDVALPERFEKQVLLLDASPGVALVGTWLQLIDGDDRPVWEWRYRTEPEAVRWALLFNSAAGHSSVMYRAEAARRAGGYSKKRLHAEDFDLWSRMARSGDLRNIPEKLVRYRIHPESVSSTSSAAQVESRLLISEDNIEATVKHGVPPEVIALLSSECTQADGALLERALRTLKEIYRKFLGAYRPGPAARAWIRRDLLERLGSMLQHVPPAERIRAMAARPHLFPARLFLSGRFLSALLHPRAKRRLKQMLRREEPAEKGSTSESAPRAGAGVR